MVKWETMTKSNKDGGLGIWEARQENIAQLAKIGGKLVLGVDNMWVSILKGKYVKEEEIMECTAKNVDSSTWKGVIRSLNMVKVGFLLGIRERGGNLILV